MFELNSIYSPITALPRERNSGYTEVRPCKELRPYIRCFWGSTGPVMSSLVQSRPVIPDTCMDIIFHTNFSKNTYDGKFCALDDSTYNFSPVLNRDVTAIFSVRFYPWSAVLFADSPMNKTKNQTFDVCDFFGGLKKELEPFLCDTGTLSAKIEAAEKILIKRLNLNKMNSDLMNSLYFIIKNNGNLKISDVCDYTGTSKKTLERIFGENTGLSPKAMQSLIQYQLLWQDIFFHRHFDVFDAVVKYGYFDQAHLLKDFKHRHCATPMEALKYALR